MHMLHSGWLPSQEQRLFFYSIFFLLSPCCGSKLHKSSAGISLAVRKKKVMGKREGNETELLTQSACSLENNTHKYFRLLILFDSTHL